MGRLWRINYISAPASLAALPRARQKRLYDDFAARIAEDSLGTDWAAFRRNLVQLESERHPVSIGEVNTSRK